MPDLIVEVLSRRTASQDRGEKRGVYERNGVLEYWLIDPPEEEVTVFRAVAGRFDGGSVYASGDQISTRVLEGLTIEVRDLMPSP